jgi:hypothetical protein
VLRVGPVRIWILHYVARVRLGSISRRQAIVQHFAFLAGAIVQKTLWKMRRAL